MDVEDGQGGWSDTWNPARLADRGGADPRKLLDHFARKTWNSMVLKLQRDFARFGLPHLLDLGGLLF